MEFALTNWMDILSIVMAFIMLSLTCLIYQLCSRLATREPQAGTIDTTVSVASQTVTIDTTVSVASQTETIDTTFVRDPLPLSPRTKTPVATSYDQVTIEDVREILNALRKHHFPASKYYMLGIQLGLFDETLTDIRKDSNQEPEMCLNKCLCKWLMQADKSCPPTWNSLIASLGIIGFNAVASGIDKEKHQACAIFEDKKSDIEKLLDEQTVRDFVKKEILKDETADQDLLQRMKDTICACHEQLKKFAFILQLLQKPEGRFLLRDYKKHYPWKQEGLEFHVKDCSEFTAMKTKFTSLFVDVLSAIKKGAIPLEDLQNFLKFYHRAPELQCQDTEEAVHLIQKNCSLINIKLLGAVLNKYNVTSVKPAIEEYEKSIEEFCRTVPLRKCLDKKFSECSPFSCETITFIIDGDVADYTVGDVKCIINRILSDIAPHVKLAVVRETESFVITCSFQLIHSHLLISVALDNIAKTDMKEFLQINIGYCTVYDASNINKEKEISIYTCKGALEQLVLSMSIHQNLSTSGCFTENDEKLINVMLEIKKLRETLQTNERLKRGYIYEIETLKSAKENKVFLSREKEAKDNSDLTDQKQKKKEDEQAERIELLRDEIKLLQKRLSAKESANEERSGKKIQMLSITHLTEMYNLLQTHSVSVKINYQKLGLCLGVKSNTLDTISQESHGDDDECLKGCLKAWLEQVDDVRMKGPPTIYSLIHALRRIGNYVIADQIDEEKHPACAIFNEYASNETIVKAIPSFIATLQNEKVITQIPANGAEVAKVKESICADHSILEKLASILQKFDRTKEVATKMKNDYLKHFGSKSTSGIKIIKISIALPDLQTVRAEYANIVASCRKAMSTIKLHELKTYLRNGYALHLDDSKTEDHALDFICDKCSLVNVTPLKKLAQQFSIHEAIDLIQKYDEVVTRFCEEKLLEPNKEHCEASHMQSKIVVVPVDKNINRRSLDDTRMLASYAFSDKVQVLVIGRDTDLY